MNYRHVAFRNISVIAHCAEPCHFTEAVNNRENTLFQFLLFLVWSFFQNVCEYCLYVVSTYVCTNFNGRTVKCTAGIRDR